MSKITGKGLVEFAKTKLGVNYVYGAKGEILTSAKLDRLYKQYGSTGFPSDYYQRSKKFIGTWCVDCSGLISWYTGKVLGSSQLYSQAIKKEKISTLDNAPIGAILWQSGHVGVYIGKENGKHYCIEAKGTLYGTVKSEVNKCKFTHWLIMDFIDYTEEEEVKIIKRGYSYGNVTKELNVVDVNGHYYVDARGLADLLEKTVQYDPNTKVTTFKNILKLLEIEFNNEINKVEAINIDGNNFTKLRDIVEKMLGYEVGYNTNTKVVTVKNKE